jgi:predicted RNase H-like nuclease
MRVAAGLDGWKEGWVGVELGNGHFRRAFVSTTLAEALKRLEDSTVVGIDMPIGFPVGGVRSADMAARTLVGSRRSSVFLVPPRAVLAAPTYASARARAIEVWGRGLSAQTYALRTKILEVEEHCKSDRRLIEVHPEVSFRELAGQPLPYAKRTWNGLQLRVGLLSSAGIAVPDRLDEVGRVPADDVLDAAVVAWSADRYANGRAAHLHPDADPELEPVIWY